MSGNDPLIEEGEDNTKGASNTGCAPRARPLGASLSPFYNPAHESDTIFQVGRFRDERPGCTRWTHVAGHDGGGISQESRPAGQEREGLCGGRWSFLEAPFDWTEKASPSSHELNPESLGSVVLPRRSLLRTNTG